MEIVKVNSEELENYPIENFIGHSKPGTGKTSYGLSAIFFIFI
ncbi:MAG: hypothetical protein WBH31_09135 [Promethearchaeia archaeon]